VFCQQRFYERYELRSRPDAPPYFSKIRRILKDDGAFVGVLYNWYSRNVVEELASLGGLTLWPVTANRLGFQVDLSRPPGYLPDAMKEPLDGSYFADVKIGTTPMKWFLPTNEIVREVNGRRELTFAPPLREEADSQKPPSAKRKQPLT
jgi:hypothetical protein